MASRRSFLGRAAAAGGEGDGKKRIVDYLNEAEGEEVAVGGAVAIGKKSGRLSPATSSSSPRTPRSLISRWWGPQDGGGGGKVGPRWAMLVRKPKKGEAEEKEKEVEAEDEKGEERSEVVSVDSSGWKPEGSKSNLGIGLSLVFLLAKTSVEFNKMVEVRTQMEMLLREIKEEIVKNGTAPDISRRCCNLLSDASNCSTNVKEIKNIELEGFATTASIEGMSCAMDSDNCEKSCEDEGCPRMDPLEEEFEVELERLQLNMDKENSSLLQRPQNTELSEFIDFAGNFDHKLEEVDEAENEDDTQYYGVSALELERKLHELLHQRHQERIEELESALQHAERKLIEKEMEICLWKDTTKLALQHENLQKEPNDTV